MLRDLFQAALDAVDPLNVLPPYLRRAHAEHRASPNTRLGHTVVLGAGKAAARMALAVEQHWPQPVAGLVVTRYGHDAPCKHIEVIEAGHPVPDDQGQIAAQRMLAWAHTLTENDLVLCLISGGGSALLTLPAPGISAEEKREINKALLASGANISEINCVRRHLSAIKGGKMGAACGAAAVITFIISDVPGDDAATVASGPTIESKSSSADAAEILQRYRIHTSAAVQAVLNTALPVASENLGAREHCIITTAQHALDAAAKKARSFGLSPLILGGSIEGESRDVAAVHAGIARQIRQHGQPCTTPCVILSGGETTVTVQGDGRGGRNAEFLLALTINAHDVPGLHALACDTDGIDGVEDNAGAKMDPTTRQRAELAGLDARDYLQRNDAYNYFLQLDDLIFTGPTRTNVNDFRALLIS